MKIERYEKIIIFQALIISLLLHFGSYKALPKKPLEASKASTAQEIEIVMSPKERLMESKKKSYIKELDQLRKLTRKVKDKAQILSKNQKRYKRQTVARKSGKTQNSRRLKQGSKSSQFKKFLRPNSALKKTLPAKATRGAFKFNAEKSRQRFKRFAGRGHTSRINTSSFSSYVPGIDKAEMTALNTDQGSLRFYTFYTRLHEQIRPRWVNMIKTIIHELPQTELKKLSYKPQITSLEVILNSKGEYVSSFIIERAQKNFLDMAALNSFKQASPFLNPPKEMIEEDGLIYIPYSFRVELSPNYFARNR